MPVPVVCPNCRKRFVVRDELRGRRVKCSACATPFEVPGGQPAQPEPVSKGRQAPAPVARREPVNPLDDFYGAGGSFDVAEVPPPTPPPPRRPVASPNPAPATAPTSGATPFRSPARRESPEWSPRERFFFRTGLQIMAAGVLALVLPLFGLQLRKLQSAGANAGAVGAGLVVLGALMSGGVLARRALLRPVAGGTGGFRVPTKFLVIGVAAVPAACIAFVLVGVLINWPRRARPTPLTPDARVPPTMPGAPPSWAPSASPLDRPPGALPPGVPLGSRTRNSPHALGPSAGGPPAPPAPRVTSPEEWGADVVAQFGADRVVRVVVTGLPARPPGSGPHPPEGAAVEKALRAALQPLLPPRPPTRTSVARYQDGVMVLVAAPIEDLSLVERSLTLGTVTLVDAEKRTVRLAIDPSKIPASP